MDNAEDVSDRISESFPPTATNNRKYMAKVHQQIKELDSPLDPGEIYIRSVQNKEELDELRLLHKEWFPPQYPDDYYKKLYMNQRIKNLILVYDGIIKGEQTTLILGGLSYERRLTDMTYMKFSFSYLWNDTFAAYILTIGVINEMRGLGLATFLLNQLEQEINDDQQIKYIYLDVVEYNRPGMKCYEKNGYIHIDHREDHYEILSNMYDSEVYIKYINGSERPKTFKEIAWTCLNAINIPKHIYNGASYAIKYVKRPKDINGKEQLESQQNNHIQLKQNDDSIEEDEKGQNGKSGFQQA